MDRRLKPLALVFVISLVAACTSTTDVINAGNGTLSVSAKAAPAAGGISGAANLAIEKARAHCAKSGKIFVKQGQNDTALNAVGAGMSSVNFKCVPKFDQAETVQCYNASREQIVSEYGEEFLSALTSKLIPTGDGFSFSQLSNSSKPTKNEVAAISIYGNALEECETNRITNFEPAAQRALNIALREELVALVELSQGKATFGEYAVAMNNINNKLSEAGARIEADQRQRAAQARQLQMQGMTNLQNQMNTIMNSGPTTCHSSYGGGVGTTTCY